MAGTKAAKEKKALTNLNGGASYIWNVFLLFEAHRGHAFVCLFVSTFNLRNFAAHAERENMKETLR